MSYVQEDTSTQIQCMAEFLRDLLHILLPYSEPTQVSDKDWPLKFSTFQGWQRILRRSQGNHLINITSMLKNARNIALIAIDANHFARERKFIAKVDKPISEGVKVIGVSRKTCNFITEFHIFLPLLSMPFVAYMRLHVNNNILFLTEGAPS
jgi:hypothetical protein